MAVNIQAYEQILQTEIKALEATVTAADNLVRQTAPQPKADLSAQARARWAEYQLSVVKECLDAVREPLRVPATFTLIDQQVPSVRTAIDVNAQVIQGARESLRRHVHERLTPDYLEECFSLRYYRSVAQMHLYQQTRLDLMPEFLREVQFWDEPRIGLEVSEREEQRLRTGPLQLYRLNLFTTTVVIDQDPFDTESRFLTELVLELKTLLARNASVDPLIEEVTQKAVSGINSVVGLTAKCAELKQLFPPNLHPVIDGLFRRQIDRLLKGGSL